MVRCVDPSLDERYSCPVRSLLNMNDSHGIIMGQFGSPEWLHVLEEVTLNLISCTHFENILIENILLKVTLDFNCALTLGIFHWKHPLKSHTGL